MSQISNNNVSHNNKAQNLPEVFSKSHENPLSRLWMKLKCTISNTKATLSLVKNKFIDALTFPARLVKKLYSEKANYLSSFSCQKTNSGSSEEISKRKDPSLADPSLADASLATLKGQEQEIDEKEIGENRFYTSLTEQEQTVPEQTVPEKDAELSKMHRALQTLRIKVANFISSRREPKEPKG